jgi:4-nitrophenyl phosphatase
VKRYPLYIFDLTPGAAEVLQELRRGGAKIRFLTNNSGKTRQFYADKLVRLGVEAEPEEVYSSATGTAALCASRGLSRVFVVGEQGLVDTLEAAGVESVDRDPAAVVVGIHRGFSYEVMNAAMQHLLSGADFIATNTDATYPLEGGRLEPGAGSIVAAISTCSGRTPEVVGKPNPFLVEIILREAGLGPEDALVVGDRIETDLLCGENAGCATHLVLCGVTPEAPDGQACSPDLRGLLE